MRMKKNIKRARYRTLPFMLFCGFALQYTTADEGPWGLIHTSTAWEGQFFASAQGESPQLGAAGLFALQGLPVSEAAFTLEAGYRWSEEEGGIASAPYLLGRTGWQTHLFKFFAWQPFLEGGWQWTTPESGFTAGGGITLLTRLSERDYLSVEPRIALPVSDPLSFRYGISAGLRRESSWLLPVRPLKPALELSSRLFSPDGDGHEDAVIARVTLQSPRSAARWSFSIVDSAGRHCLEREGKGTPPETLEWNGLTIDGELPVPGEEYRIRVQIADKANRTAILERTVTCDILIVADGDRYKVRVPAIRFPKNSFTLTNAESRELYDANRETLNRIAELFLLFPDYSLIVEGHANPVWRNDPVRFKKEQETELIPLSRKRAEAVRNALILAGIDELRMGIIAKGGLEPLNTDQNPESIAKNRRVEFILVRNANASVRLER